MPDQNQEKKIKPEGIGLPIDKQIERSESEFESGQEKKLDQGLEQEKTFEEKLKEKHQETFETKKETSASLVQTFSNLNDQEKEKRIEKILEKDLMDFYLNLSPQKQEQFRQGGEETARKINALLKKTKVKIKHIINLIIKWLTILPGVNKFFLEKEAKKKAEEIIRLKQE